MHEGCRERRYPRARELHLFYSTLVQRVRDMLYFSVPTRTARSTVNGFPFTSSTHETASWYGRAMNGTLWQSSYPRCGAVNECRRYSHRQILWKAMFSEEVLDDPILPRWQPVTYFRSPLGHSADFVEHRVTLEIPTIEPTEVRSTGLCRLPIDQLDHRLDPVWIIAALEPTLISTLHFGIAKETLEGITLLTHRSLNLGQLAAGDTALCWNTPGVTGHP